MAPQIEHAARRIRLAPHVSANDYEQALTMQASLHCGVSACLIRAQLLCLISISNPG
jgi:hypothetical protein